MGDALALGHAGGEATPLGHSVPHSLREMRLVSFHTIQFFDTPGW